jgi:hypothetical protein
VTRTHDEPVEITDLAPDKSVVRIRQISEGSLDHVHRFNGGLIARMDIQNVEASPR